MGRTAEGGAIVSSPKKSKGKFFNTTDAGNGELFAHLYGGCVLFDHRQERWLFWNTKQSRWQPDDTRRVRLLGKRVASAWFKKAREMSRSDKKNASYVFKWAYKSESASGIDATLRQAQTEPPISDAGDGWDADPWLFGVANGVVDLRTGKFRAGTQADRITKFSPVAFDAAAQCPRFLQFMDEIFAGDTELVRYVQKAIGYSLTGEAREQCLFACWGSGANGKSTLLELLFFILGDYACDLSFSSLEAKQHRLGDGVKLLGARFVKAVEVREDTTLDEARVKSWTGGDTISVRPLYRQEISFQPTHKIWIAFNHKPRIQDDSVAMWRRIQLIPFNRTFGVQHADKGLLHKLRNEAVGVLNWAVEGCLAWQQEGLQTPQAVERATIEYADESDHLAAFLEECCDTDALLTVPKRELRSRYESWCSTHHERPKNRNDFSQAIRSRGFGEGSNGACKFWKGLRIRPPDPTDPTLGALNFSPGESNSRKEVVNAQSSVSSVSDPAGIERVLSELRGEPPPPSVESDTDG
jgi:putative DNA primase/helicase